jgi:hypothetical protein
MENTIETPYLGTVLTLSYIKGVLNLLLDFGGSILRWNDLGCFGKLNNNMRHSIAGWNLLKSMANAKITPCLNTVLTLSYIKGVLNLLLGFGGSILRWNDLGYFGKLKRVYHQSFII